MNTEEYNDMVEKILKELINSLDRKELIKIELTKMNKTLERIAFHISQHTLKELLVSIKKIEIILDADNDKKGE